jgi:O-antigen biosynthesis protein WbqP
MPKYRTMVEDAPLSPREALDGAESHITPVGAWLRRSALDELPQLFCILTGDMSIIGPRPLLPADPGVVARRGFPDAVSARPGLSGLAQVVGRNSVSPRRKARLDAFYARSASFGLDVIIFWRTAGIVMTSRGFL